MNEPLRDEHASARVSGSGEFDEPASVPPSLARFTLLYESRDGGMCLFEDADGHLVAVRAALLA